MVTEVIAQSHNYSNLFFMTLDWVHVYNVPKIMSGEHNINSFEEMLRDGRL